MPLQPYAASPARRARQLTADVAVLLWAVACAVTGVVVHGAVVALADPARSLAQGAGGLRDQLGGAADAAGKVPLVGDRLSAPLDGASGSADDLATAGLDLATTIGHLAAVLGLAVAVLPVLLVVALWLPARWRFARRAGAARAWLDDATATPGPTARSRTELLAWRALVNQPLGTLASVSSDPLADLRGGDPRITAALAALERRSLGLPPYPRP
ncbi:hypothetical protein SAMN06264364_10566 [Quadrisphaera granulorum]|uniref:Transmembrane protein n=1 Tax=Quadrisphaera granulorum TaxID=317664 RepID=A0A316AD11_9ACTN|nr:hypothetical protein [Quadrisphaera granulorum]PWJ54860.1 hypothetical protein BXY45_10566 [Quadrisphaera granulorum]SZE95806.1 hypothetical protein SAMN06264364_10566 [Quadrisphaera granulorum]